MLIHVSLHPVCIEGGGPDQLSSDYAEGRNVRIEGRWARSLHSRHAMRFRPCTLFVSSSWRAGLLVMGRARQSNNHKADLTLGAHFRVKSPPTCPSCRPRNSS